MVIGMDIREAAGRPAGKGRFVAELMRMLPSANPADSFVWYTDRSHQDDRSNVTVRVVSGPGPVWHLRTARLANRECDAYLAATSYLTPQSLRIPIVIVVHDLIAFTPVARPQRRAQLIERLTLSRAVSRASRIVAVSDSTARDLAARYPAAADKTAVAPLAADPAFHPYPDADVAAIRNRYKIRDFILSTGTIEPRKNLDRLVRAYSYLPEALRERYPLLLVGKPGWHADRVFAAVRETRMGTFVRHLGYVADEDLAKLYAAATVFAYPSLYEGFGLPVLEAMQSGTPVITSRTSALPEVTRDAAVLIDPRQTKQLAAALRDLLESPGQQRQLSAAGRKRAQDFSWERTTAIVREAITAAVPA